jgi:hypothetical protein
MAKKSLNGVESTYRAVMEISEERQHGIIPTSGTGNLNSGAALRGSINVEPDAQRAAPDYAVLERDVAQFRSRSAQRSVRNLILMCQPHPAEYCRNGCSWSRSAASSATCSALWAHRVEHVQLAEAAIA